LNINDLISKLHEARAEAVRHNNLVPEVILEDPDGVLFDADEVIFGVEEDAIIVKLVEEDEGKENT